jgi:hypothetical protein
MCSSACKRDRRSASGAARFCPCDSRESAEAARVRHGDKLARIGPWHAAEHERASNVEPLNIARRFEIETIQKASFTSTSR